VGSRATSYKSLRGPAFCYLEVSVPDITLDVLPRLRQHRLPGLDLGDDFIYPNYAGYSIINIPSTICRLLGASDLNGLPLNDEIRTLLGDSYRHVILVLIDGLALHRLQRWIAEGAIPVWDKLVAGGLLAPLTSITPSTTSAALTSIWTGRSAAEHGIVGYEMWLKEYGVVANTVLHSPMSFKSGIGSLANAGFTPEGFMTLPTLDPHLRTQGIKNYAFQHYSITQSGLSQMYFRGLTVRGFSTAADLWINLRHLLESSRDEKQFIWVYWGEIDHLSHFYGPDDERPEAEFASFSADFERLFLNRLAPEAREDTLLIMTADHGEISTRIDPYYDLKNHPSLERRLHIRPTGENRLAYLHVRPGQSEAVREYLERTWPNQFILVDPAFAVESGLFGPGTPHPGLHDRMGDTIVVARGDAYLWWGDKENHLYGRHGGLHPDEMLVPFLAARL
jgi:predicted AlkP superfamily pyrophosphatase or phosphodiesterase